MFRLQLTNTSLFGRKGNGLSFGSFLPLSAFPVAGDISSAWEGPGPQLAFIIEYF